MSETSTLFMGLKASNRILYVQQSGPNFQQPQLAEQEKPENSHCGPSKHLDVFEN